MEVQVSYSGDYLIVFECLPIPTPAVSSADPADPPERLPFDPRTAAGPATVRPTLPGPMASDGPDPSHPRENGSIIPSTLYRPYVRSCALAFITRWNTCHFYMFISPRALRPMNCPRLGQSKPPVLFSCLRSPCNTYWFSPPFLEALKLFHHGLAPSWASSRFPQ